MAWFHPKTLLDKTYEIGIIIKGFDGTVELIGGFLVLFLSPNSIHGIVRFLTERSLQENPHGYFSNHIVKIGFDLTHGSHIFAALFLITHGLVKVVLVTCLLLNKMWAYPWALGALWAFLIYQIYLLATNPTFFMAFLFVLDAIIIYLVGREWKVQKAK
jgi:uncharacterized membrane protein